MNLIQAVGHLIELADPKESDLVKSDREAIRVLLDAFLTPGGPDTLAAEIRAELGMMPAAGAQPDGWEQVRDDARLRHAWETGFKLCASYGDNRAHFTGDQADRQWLKVRDQLRAAPDGLPGWNVATPIPPPIRRPRPSTPPNPPPAAPVRPIDDVKERAASLIESLYDPGPIPGPEPTRLDWEVVNICDELRRPPQPHPIAHPSHPGHESTLAAIERILKGIDSCDTCDDDAWWETSTGAALGKSKLLEIRALFSPRGDMPLPLFSERRRIITAAEQWCDAHGVPQSPFNVVSGLFALGHLRKP